MVIVANKRERSDGVYIGRPSPLGNPFVPRNKTQAERDRVCDAYEHWLRAEFANPAGRARAELLRLVGLAKRGDLVLVCFCKPLRCHGDFIKHAIETLIEKGF